CVTTVIISEILFIFLVKSHYRRSIKWNDATSLHMWDDEAVNTLMILNASESHMKNFHILLRTMVEKIMLDRNKYSKFFLKQVS
ncbi:hypothetical protein Leryth_023765, partial [Lithospermum erythrorhizon]